MPYIQKRRPWKGQRKKRKKPGQHGYKLGGCTGRGFVPGMSGNPSGRNFSESAEINLALVARLHMTGTAKLDGETFKLTKAAFIAASLEELALNLRLPAAIRLRAIVEIMNRTEGMPRQRVEVDDRRSQPAAKSKEELQFFLVHGRWPEEMQSAPGDDVDQKKPS